MTTIAPVDKITIVMPFSTLPLRSNQRLHWHKKAELTRQIRYMAKLAAYGFPEITGPVAVTLIWTVPDKRRRDVGAGSPTLKAAIDGIVDAKVLPADDSTVVTEERCRIEYRKGESAVRIEIEGHG